MSDTISEEPSSLPEYFQYVRPVMEVQKELGGLTRPAEIVGLVLDKLKPPKKTFAHPSARSSSIDGNDIQKVRHVLIHAGLLHTPRKGVWKLTDKGLATDPSDINLHQLNELRKSVDKAYRENRKRKDNRKPARADASDGNQKATPRDQRRTRSLDQLKALAPDQLENVCKSILHLSGFEKVNVTKRSSDGFLEGVCVFEENPLDRSYVLFQYRGRDGAIAETEVRAFRSAMVSRADKGILMTTCTFTTDAKHEAYREGVCPIQLVDGNKLIELIAKFKIRLEGF